MGDHDGCQTEFVVQATIVVAERVTRYRVEGTERLIHQDDAAALRRVLALRRPAGAGHRKVHAETIAVIGRGRVAPDRSTHRPERQFRILASPSRLGRDADVGGDSHMRKQAAALEHIADAAAQPDRVDFGDILARNGDSSGVGIDQAIGEPQQCGLARAGTAEARNSPAAMANETSSTALAYPSLAQPPLKLLATCENATSGEVSLMPAGVITRSPSAPSPSPWWQQ